MVTIALTRTRAADLVELVKPRIVVMVLLTAAAGFWLARPGTEHAMILFHLLLGTMLVASGSNAANQIAERDVDLLMRRTQSRPLPAGRLDVGPATVFAWTLSLTGIFYLGTVVNALTGALAAATFISYVFVYTPLKRKTTTATLIGSIPGALPIVGGWTAVSGTLSAETWVLFWILFLWQLPHFLALGWIYKDDYSRAGLKMLSGDDPDGRVTFLNATVYAAALLPVSLMPTILGLSGSWYFLGGLGLSGWLLLLCLRAFHRCDIHAARTVFRASLAYLPAVLVLMCVDRMV